MAHNEHRDRQTNVAAPPDPVDAIIERYRSRPQAVVALLQDIHRLHGYLPEEVLERAGRELEVPLSRLYSLATFYASFRLTPVGRHRVCVCVGTACHVKGADRIVEALQRDLQVNPGETTTDGEFTVETVNCLGTCALAPVVVVDDEYHGRLDAKKATQIVRRAGEAAAKPADGATAPAMARRARPDASPMRVTTSDIQRIAERMRAAMSLREGVGRAKITVHMGTCGISAGARGIMSALLACVDESGAKDVIFSTSGCAGLCSHEPMITVEVAGQAPVKYVDLDEQKSRRIFSEHVMGGRIVAEYALAIGSEQTL